jgi:hypothetical protein
MNARENSARRRSPPSSWTGSFERVIWGECLVSRDSRSALVERERREVLCGGDGDCTRCASLTGLNVLDLDREDLHSRLCLLSDSSASRPWENASKIDFSRDATTTPRLFARCILRHPQMHVRIQAMLTMLLLSGLIRLAPVTRDSARVCSLLLPLDALRHCRRRRSVLLRKGRTTCARARVIGRALAGHHHHRPACVCDSTCPGPDLNRSAFLSRSRLLRPLSLSPSSPKHTRDALFRFLPSAPRRAGIRRPDSRRRRRP